LNTINTFPADSTYSRRRVAFIVTAVVMLILVLDQWLKIWIKTHMEVGQEFSLLGQSWMRIHFVENEGMAYGLSLGGKTGKLILTLFRFGAIGFLIYLMRKMIREGYAVGLLIFFAMIIGGAIGNLLDSIFYGVIFDDPGYHGGVAKLFPPEGGYGKLLYGRVVDMLYFPILDFHWPDWMPIVGGQRFEFFRPVFNLADSCITTGILGILLFYRKHFFGMSKKEISKTSPTPSSPE